MFNAIINNNILYLGEHYLNCPFSKKTAVDRPLIIYNDCNDQNS